MSRQSDGRSKDFERIKAHIRAMIGKAAACQERGLVRAKPQLRIVRKES